MNFAALALRLADLGYSPIPLEGKAPKGKALEGWSRQREPDPAWIAEKVRTHPGHNIGIVCSRVVALDLDILDPELAHRLDELAVKLLGEGPLRIGRWPKRMRVYRTNTPLRKIKAGVQGALIEVLAEGQQFAAFGIHPDTGRPYTWPEGDLTEWALEDLPQVTPEALLRFAAEAAALLPRPEEAPARARARAAGTQGGGEVVRNADGRVVDGRDAYLSTLAFHAVRDATERGTPLHAETLAVQVWERFCDNAELGDAKGSGHAWSEGDALRKVRDKLRLHVTGALPERSAETVAPLYPLPSSTKAQARLEVARDISGVFMRTLAWHATPKAQRGEAEHVGLPVDVAVGKTRTTCEGLPGFIATAKGRELPHRVLFTVPTHKLGGEVNERLAKLGVHVATWRGREAEDPDAPAGANDRRMCRNLAAVQDAMDAFQDVEESACGKGDGARCPFFAGCAYQRQKARAAAADVVVAAHEAMLGTLPAGIGAGFALVIADESWWQDGYASRQLGIETLAAGPGAHPVLHDGNPHRPNDLATNDLHALRPRMAAALQASPVGYLTRAALTKAGLTEADCNKAGALEWKRKVEGVLRPGMSEEARREGVRLCRGNAAIPALAALWKAAGELLKSGGEATGRVEVAEVEDKEGLRRVLRLNTFRKVADAVMALPLLALDATLQEALLRHRLPRLTVLPAVRAATPDMHVHYLTGGFAKTSVVPRKRKPDEPEDGDEATKENTRRERRNAEVRDFVGLRSDGERSLLITYQDLESHFAGLPGVETAHFNAVAGRDEWRDVRHLFVIGRPAPAPEDVRRLAAALTGRPIPAEHPQRVTRNATMRDGSGAPVQVRAYLDPDLEAVRAGITDAEIVQDIGRGRGINRTGADPLHVWLIGADVVVPLPLDSLCRWQDVEPSLHERMAARGVVLTSPSDAARAYPDLFPNGEKAAREALGREAAAGGGRTEHGPKALWIIPIGVWVRVRPIRVAYRPNLPKAKTRTAWAHPDRLPGLRAWLEGVTGATLAHFAPDPPPDLPPPAPPATEPDPMPEATAPPPEVATPLLPEPEGLHPSAFGMRRVGRGLPEPFAPPGGMTIHLRGDMPPDLRPIMAMRARHPGPWALLAAAQRPRQPSPGPG